MALPLPLSMPQSVHSHRPTSWQFGSEHQTFSDHTSDWDMAHCGHLDVRPTSEIKQEADSMCENSAITGRY